VRAAGATWVAPPRAAMRSDDRATWRRLTRPRRRGVALDRSAGGHVARQGGRATDGSSRRVRAAPAAGVAPAARIGRASGRTSPRPLPCPPSAFAPLVPHSSLTAAAPCRTGLALPATLRVVLRSGCAATPGPAIAARPGPSAVRARSSPGAPNLSSAVAPTSWQVPISRSLRRLDRRQDTSRALGRPGGRRQAPPHPFSARRRAAATARAACRERMRWGLSASTGSAKGARSVLEPVQTPK